MPAVYSCFSVDLQKYTCLLVIKEAAVNAAWDLVASIKHNIIFHVLIVVPCIAAVKVRQTVYLGQNKTTLKAVWSWTDRTDRYNRPSCTTDHMHVPIFQDQDITHSTRGSKSELCLDTDSA